MSRRTFPVREVVRTSPGLTPGTLRAHLACGHSRTFLVTPRGYGSALRLSCIDCWRALPPRTTAPRKDG